MRSHPDPLEGLDEPVRRFLGHAVRAGAPPVAGMRLRMSGRIKAGRWLPFTARQEMDGRSFLWRARVGLGPLTLLRVDDRYGAGAGSVRMRLFGRLAVDGADGPDTTRSAAGRAALEVVAFAPACALPGSGVTWRAQSEDVVVAGFDLPPERPQVRVRIDGDGAPLAVWSDRWSDAGREGFGYVPCGCEILGERRVGDLAVPSRLRVGWWFGTPRYAPFFEATIDEVEPVPARRA